MGENAPEGSDPATQRWEWDLDLAASQSGTTPENMPPPMTWDTANAGESVRSAGMHHPHPHANDAPAGQHGHHGEPSHIQPPHGHAHGHHGNDRNGGDAEPPFMPPAWAGAPVIGPHSGPQDQAAIYAALMSYMVEAAKTS